MARGNSRAQSEAGTITRDSTTGRRIRDAKQIIDEARSDRNIGEGGLNRALQASREVLTDYRMNKERYVIDMADVSGGRDSNRMAQVGKLNLVDGTIEGNPIQRQSRGAIDRMGVLSTSSDRADVDYATENANKEQGFVFATDGKQVYALPHEWDINDPQGTVGVFRGDEILTNGKRLEVIGSFDSSPRGLQAAAVAAGAALGRDRGVKQTAIVLTHDDKGSALDSITRGTARSVFGNGTTTRLRDGVEGLGVKRLG